jgi:chemotaxis protein methyltransferase CheR
MRDGIALANAIVDTVRDPLVVLDQDLRVIAASRSFYNTFGLGREDVRGRLFYEVDQGQWDIPELRELLGAISNGQATVEGYEVDREFRGIGRRVMLLNGRKVFYEEGAHSTVLLAFEDVTNRRAIERQVEDLLRDHQGATTRARLKTGHQLGPEDSAVIIVERQIDQFAGFVVKNSNVAWRIRMSILAPSR